MKRRLLTSLKISVLALSLMAFCLVTVYTAAAQPTHDNSLLRVEVSAHNGENVSVSVPVSILDTVYDIMPEDIKEICEHAELTPKAIVEALEELEGEDLVNVEGRDSVRVWLEPVTAKNRKDLGFVKVRVVESHNGEDETVVNVKIPRGLVQLVGVAVDQLGILDEIDIDLPIQIKSDN